MCCRDVQKTRNPKSDLTRSGKKPEKSDPVKSLTQFASLKRASIFHENPAWPETQKIWIKARI